MAEQKFPSEVIDLPSEGKLYPEGHPLKNGKIEIKYMTAKEEDILTSQNLVKKGLAIDTLLKSLIVTKDVNLDDLILGDKNAVMVAARVLAYGPEYLCSVTNPKTGEVFDHTFNLAECPFNKLPDNVTENKFTVELPLCKKTIEFKILTGKDEMEIEKELKNLKKIPGQISRELTTRLKHIIISVDGDNSPAIINNFVENMLARDSLHFRNEIKKVQPDIELKQHIEVGGETVEVDIPMTVGFFWPDA